MLIPILSDYGYGYGIFQYDEYMFSDEVDLKVVRDALYTKHVVYDDRGYDDKSRAAKQLYEWVEEIC